MIEDKIKYLKYKKGDLIIKEGDYGVSIYKIITGKVKIYSEIDDQDIPLSVLGPGEIIGEMMFLTNYEDVRSASARAIEDTEMEVWHPVKLSEEYKDIPPIIKYLADYTLKRLNRTNKLYGQLLSKNQDKLKKENQNPAFDKRRTYYRKEVNRQCEYRSAGSPKIVFKGMVKDISRGGLALEINAVNAIDCSHEPGEIYHINFTLPNGKDVEVKGKIQTIKKLDDRGKLFLGISFFNISEESQKRIGFFLMP